MQNFNLVTHGHDKKDKERVKNLSCLLKMRIYFSHF
jgi:hypothetical protein